MSILISGSLAYDTVFDHEDTFLNTIKGDAIDHLNVTFQASGMRRTIGGCAGNIAYSLKQLGGDPLIWTAVGCDAGAFMVHLENHNIPTDGISTYMDTYSAQAVITTDKNGCQLTTFYSGAMAYADKIPFPKKDVSLAIFAPTTHDPLLAHAAALKKRGIPYLLDTGQTTPLFSGKELLSLVKDSIGVCFSVYEGGVYRSKTGLTPEELSKLCPAVYCTDSGHGSTVFINGENHHIPAKPTECVDPVGAGDAYRGGLLWGLDHGYSPIQSARFGALIAAQKVAVAGPNYTYSEEELLKDYEAFFKDEDL